MLRAEVSLPRTTRSGGNRNDWCNDVLFINVYIGGGNAFGRKLYFIKVFRYFVMGPYETHFSFLGIALFDGMF